MVGESGRRPPLARRMNPQIVRSPRSHTRVLPMARAPFQVLVYPYRRIDDDTWEYALLKRAEGAAREADAKLP